MSSSSSCSSSDEWDSGLGKLQQPKKKITKKRNIREIEQNEGESNIKGFVSAFNTIMVRTDSPLVPAVTAEKPITSSVKKEPVVMLSHATVPAMNCEKELALKAAAQRGVVKLFKAVAMHKKKVFDQEAQKGIGVMRNGKIRPKRMKKSSAPVEGGGVSNSSFSSSTKTMSGFLEALKKSKSSAATVSR